MSVTLGSVWSKTLDVLFPPRCVGCGDFGAFLCQKCLAGAPYAIGPRCARCWKAWYGDSCSHCARHRSAVLAQRAAFAYDGVAREAVIALKFQGVSALAQPMARQMARTLADWAPPVDVVVPVPLGWLRSRTRGYNQAALLASEVCRSSGFRLETRALRRVRQTPPQSQQPDEDARLANVRTAFALGPRPVAGSVLLIDDVATTGATLDACARVLLDGGAESVYALTFARED